jgi:hypothetical protein
MQSMVEGHGPMIPSPRRQGQSPVPLHHLRWSPSPEGKELRNFPRSKANQIAPPAHNLIRTSPPTGLSTTIRRKAENGLQIPLARLTFEAQLWLVETMKPHLRFRRETAGTKREN